MRVCAVVLAAGRGERVGFDKTQALLGDRPVWRWSYDMLRANPGIDAVGVVGSASNLEVLKSGAPESAFAILGGATRQQSCRLAVEAVSPEYDAVLIHDAARPFVSAAQVGRVLAGVTRSGAAAPGVAVPDTLRRPGGVGYEILDRARVVAMQTPQGALRERLLAAHHSAKQDYTDEMELLKAAGYPFEIVEGEELAFKITTPSDMERARGMIGGLETRTGLGYDVHAFSSDPGRTMMLGGVAFEGPALDGHSDADVLLHAIVDALLGAAVLGDIGRLFPNTDPRWHNEPSSTFLRHAGQLLAEAGWQIVHIDAALLAEHPKISPRVAEMQSHIAGVLSLGNGRVSIKATTNERLGAIGRGEGIAAFATATIRRLR